MKERTQTSLHKRVVLASGTFDLLHLGQVRYLEEARKAGGPQAKLIVIVARDSTVVKRKGKRPVMPEDQRRVLVESLKVVDEALLGFEEFNMNRVVEKIQPDIIAVGYDQAGIEEEVRRALVEKIQGIQIVRIGRFGDKELSSSSKIKRKIIESYKRKHLRE
jgi:FAD synthetase